MAAVRGGVAQASRLRIPLVARRTGCWREHGDRREHELVVGSGGSGYNVWMISRKAPPAAALPALSSAAFPQLESFFSDYLHEDFLVEYGSPEGALRAWRLSASAREIRQFEREARLLLDAAAAMPFDAIAAFVRRGLGSTWRPSDKARLQKLFEAQPRRPAQ